MPRRTRRGHRREHYPASHCVTFDGVNDYVTLTSAAAPIAASSATVAVWLRVGSVPVAGFEVLVGASFSASTNPEWSIGITSAGKIQWYAEDNAGALKILSVPATPINDAAWHHVVVVMGATSGVVYIDGSSAATPSYTGDFSDLDRLSIGCITKAGSPSRHSEVDVADVAVWDLELAAAEVSDLAAGRIDARRLTPRTWLWCGDGDTYPTLRDRGWGRTDGTMTNMIAGDIVAGGP